MDQKTNIFIAKSHEIWVKDQKKVFFSKHARIFTNFEVKKKKLFNSKNARICTKSGVKPQEKRVFITKSVKKQFLLTNSRVINSISGVSGLVLHFSGTKPVTFLGTQSSLRGHNSRLWGTSSDWGGSTALN